MDEELFEHPPAGATVVGSQQIIRSPPGKTIPRCWAREALDSFAIELMPLPARASIGRDVYPVWISDQVATRRGKTMMRIGTEDGCDRIQQLLTAQVHVVPVLAAIGRTPNCAITPSRHTYHRRRAADDPQRQCGFSRLVGPPLPAISRGQDVACASFWT